jgi:hypothetical protein
MRLMRSFSGVIACTVLAAGPAVAGQRGHHQPTPHPAAAATHTAAPAHPAAPAAKAPHPAHAAVVPKPITSNPALVARLTPLLPSGMTLANASAGFKNRGQFIAALHVSRNLNIPFDKLKADMTGARHLSLGQSIQDLRPETDVKTAVRTAETASRADLKATRHAKKTDAADRR